MKKLSLTIVLLLSLTCLSVGAAPPESKGKAIPLVIKGDTVTLIKSLPFEVHSELKKNTTYRWFVPDSFKAEKKGNILKVSAAPKGSHKITLYTTTVDFKKEELTENEETIEVNIGEITPDPGPGPKPPDPPDPSIKPPIDAPGFRVLMVYDPQTKAKLTENQKDVLEGRDVYDFLKANCVVDKDNEQGAFRVWASTTNTSGSSKPWQDAMKRERKSLPWMIVSNGKTGYEGPLPNNSSEAMELLKKYLPLKSKSSKEVK